MGLPVTYCLHNVHHKLMWTLSAVLLFVNITAAETEADTSQQISTQEPDAMPGCKAPDIRFSVFKPETTTEQPFAHFETTQVYLSEDFTTADVEFIERINIDLTGIQSAQMGDNVNPYQVDLDRDHKVGADITSTNGRNKDNMEIYGKQSNKAISKNNKNLGADDGRNEKDQSRVRSRHKRQLHIQYSSNPLKNHSGNELIPGVDVYYLDIKDILKSLSSKNKFQYKLYKLKNGEINENRDTNKKNYVSLKILSEDEKNKSSNKEQQEEWQYQLNLKPWDNRNIKDNAEDKSIEYRKYQQQRQYQRNKKNRGRNIHDVFVQEKRDLFKYMLRRSMQRYKQNNITKLTHNYHNIQDGTNNEQNNGSELTFSFDKKNVNNFEVGETKKPPLWRTKEVDDYAHLHSISKINALQRVKRKSGKTTGALSRPKGGSDSGSKTTSRKDKGPFEEDGGYTIHQESVESEEEDEEGEDIDIQQKFTEVSEIRFPGEIGPLGDRRLCKIRCIKGKWVGPLCATNEEDENGNVKFQPLYKSCHVQRIPPYLLLSYRNISVTPIYRSRRNRTSKSNFISNTQINVGWDVPHGHSLQARCKDLGMYKLLGESRVLCSDGLWAPRMPSCVPTTLLTNFSDDSAPSIRYIILNGSGSFEPSGVMAVLPHSSISLDCMYPRSKGIPEWTWTSWYMQYPTGWAHEDRNLRYRLTIRDIENGDTGTFTCTSPRGLTNSISIVVTTSTCPQLPVPPYPLTLNLEGNKLGQRALYRCPPGYQVDGVANISCLASGNWSSLAPTCHAVQCPRLILNDPHLSLVELNTSVWGRAVFKCQWGFKLSGTPIIECEPTGIWSGHVPRCKAIQCPIPVAPLNGRIGGTNLNQRRLTVGALITFSCNEGHTLIGEPSIICTESGFWSHSPPFCKSQCPYPGDPPNGLLAPLKFSYDSGDYVSVQCRPGYVQFSENGPPERPKCQPDGNWSRPVPKCLSYEEI